MLPAEAVTEPTHAGDNYTNYSSLVSRKCLFITL
jgi:hypothetical protein